MLSSLQFFRRPAIRVLKSNFSQSERCSSTTPEPPSSNVFAGIICMGFAVAACKGIFDTIYMSAYKQGRKAGEEVGYGKGYATAKYEERTRPRYNK